MKVGLVSNFNEQCGISTYAEDLVRYKNANVEYELIYNTSLVKAVSLANSCDIIHINFYPAVGFGFDFKTFLENVDKKFILTNHSTKFQQEWYKSLSVVVTHLPVISGYFLTRNVHIPHGIPEKNLSNIKPSKLILSQSGFPFAWKNFPVVCKTASILYKNGVDVSVILFMPNTDRSPVDAELLKCKTALNPNIDSKFITDWLDEDILIQRLHDEASVMLHFTSGSVGTIESEGPSGSVRISIASQRPVVLNANASQYVDLLKYDGIYGAYSEEELPDLVMKAYTENKTTKDLIEDQSYKKMCDKYYNLYLQELS